MRILLTYFRDQEIKKFKKLRVSAQEMWLKIHRKNFCKFSRIYGNFGKFFYKMVKNTKNWEFRNLEFRKLENSGFSNSREDKFSGKQKLYTEWIGKEILDLFSALLCVNEMFCTKIFFFKFRIIDKIRFIFTNQKNRVDFFLDN